MKNKAYLWVRSAVILLLFVGGFLALLTFYNAKFQKIPPPVKISSVLLCHGLFGLRDGGLSFGGDYQGIAAAKTIILSPRNHD